jgi:pilus assembly protein Flp/PilA
MPPTFYDRIKALAKVFREIAGVVYTKASAMTRLRQFLRDQSGASSIEYGLIAAGISLAIIAVVQGLGTKIASTFTGTEDAMR